MDAVTSSWPPAGAPTFALVVWTRPEVQLLPLPSAVMSRWPLPSWCTFEVEFVMFSISPVPQTPWPVSYIHCESMPLPAPPEKLSLNTVDQPDGGPGTVVADAGAIATASVSANIMAGTGHPNKTPRSRRRAGPLGPDHPAPAHARS